MSKHIISLPVESPLEISGGGNSLTIHHVGMRGDKGDKGDTGVVGGNIIIIAPVNLGGNRVVMADGNYADNIDVATLNKAIGITKTSALSGAEVEIVTVAELNGFSGLSINEIVYLASNGTVTQVLPVSGYIQQIGVASSSTTILINISSSINR